MRQHISLLPFFAIMIGVLSFAPLAAQDTFVSLSTGSALQDYVNNTDAANWYHFNARTDQSLFLLIVSAEYDNAPSLVISNARTNENIATARMGINGLCMRFAPGSENYTLAIAADRPAETQWYGIMMETGAPTEMLCPETMRNAFTSGFSTSTFETISGDAANAYDRLLVADDSISTDSNCNASSGVNVGVNVRATNALDAEIVGRIGVDTLVPVIGSTTDNLWLAVNMDDTLGFASSGVLAVSGDCTSIPVVIISDNTIIGTGTLSDLTSFVNLDTNIGGVDAGTTLALGDNELADVDAAVSLEDGANVTANIGVGGENSVAGVDVGVSGGGTNIGVNLGEEEAVGIDIGGGNGGSGSGSGVCINALGIRILC